MTEDAYATESSVADPQAMGEYARLALALTAARGVRLETKEESVAVGELSGEPAEVPVPGVGSILLYGGEPNPELELLVHRISARVQSDRAHADALALAERANDIARSATRRFEALFEGLPVACYTCDAEGTLREWNRAAEEMWGLAIVGGWGKPVVSIVDPESPEAEQEVLNRALAGETVRVQERKILDGSGETRWHLASAFPVRDGEGNTVGAMAVRVDITGLREAQRELAEREARFRALFEALTSAGAQLPPMSPASP